MVIDLRSDTVTKPSEEMRDAARDAEVGDDVYRDDPTVNELEREAAEAVGKEAALFVPSGTMGNQIAARVHTDRGQEVVLDAESHVFKYELGGLAQQCGLQTRTVDFGDRCAPTPEQVHENYVEEDLHRAGTGLLCLENSHNVRGGAAVPKEYVDAAAEAAHEHDVPVHVDGARLFNACVALDEDPADMVEQVDSVMFCLSKGLGAPVGSMVAGDEAFIDQARRVRKLLGGGMRQAGMVAAPGLLALDNVDRLQEDHENAERLAEGLAEVEGLDVPTPDTNILVVDVEGTGMDPDEFCAEVERQGVLITKFGPQAVRFTTNWDVSAGDIDAAVDAVRTALS